VPTSIETATPFLPRGFDNLPTASAALRPTPDDANPTAVAPGTLHAEAILGRLNQLRAAQGLRPLVEDASLSTIARRRAETLAESKSLSHFSGGAAEAEASLAAAGFAGRVAEVALSARSGQGDPLGALLQALLTDTANQGVVFDDGYGLAGFGLAQAGDWIFVVGLLAETGPPPASGAAD
jgi:uncharacterized protein YkwD